MTCWRVACVAPHFPTIRSRSAQHRFYFGARESRPKRWRDIRSAEHSTSGIADMPAVEELIARTQAGTARPMPRITLANSIDSRCSI